MWSKWSFWPIFRWFDRLYIKNTSHRSRSITFKIDIRIIQKSPEKGNFIWIFRIFGEKHKILAFNALKCGFDQLSIFFNNFRFQKLILFPKYDRYQKKRSIAVKVAIKEYFGRNPLLKKRTVFCEKKFSPRSSKLETFFIVLGIASLL